MQMRGYWALGVKGFQITLTDNQALLKTAKHITQYQQLSKVDINWQFPQNFANKCQLSIPGVDYTILHVNCQGSNLQKKWFKISKTRFTDTSLLWTVWFVPEERKPLHFL